MKWLLILSLSFVTSILFAETCPFEIYHYGNQKKAQEIACRLSIDSYKIDSDSSRQIILNDDGLLHVANNVPGSTVSLSLGARVFYLLPNREKKAVLNSEKDSLQVKTSSGAVLHFDKDGVMSSPDLKMTYSKTINNQNKGGVEIQSYKKGLVIDLGWRLGTTPALKPDQPIRVIDKNEKVCHLLNKDITVFQGKNDSSPKYKTNKEMFAFLSQRCPGLDLSDFQEKVKPVESWGKDDLAKLVESLNKKTPSGQVEIDNSKRNKVIEKSGSASPEQTVHDSNTTQK